tara:strand:+ start:703 stop:1845 length:1143 start_codon:yes stop_codon:yes gene_type:complete
MLIEVSVDIVEQVLSGRTLRPVLNGAHNLTSVKCSNKKNDFVHHPERVDRSTVRPFSFPNFPQRCARDAAPCMCKNSGRDDILARLKRQRGAAVASPVPLLDSRPSARRPSDTPPPVSPSSRGHTSGNSVTFQDVFDAFTMHPRLYDLPDAANIKTVYDMMQNMTPPRLAAAPSRSALCIECGGEVIAFTDCSSCVHCGLSQPGPQICDENPFRSFDCEETSRSQWTQVDDDGWRPRHRVPLTLKAASVVSHRSANEERADRRDEAFSLVNVAIDIPLDALAKARGLYNLYADVHRVSKSINLAVACVFSVMSIGACGDPMDSTQKRGVTRGRGEDDEKTCAAAPVNVWRCPHCSTVVDGLMRRRHHSKRCVPRGGANAC